MCLGDALYISFLPFSNVEDFLIEVVNSRTIPKFQRKNKKLQFINYGDTQLVYVLTAEEKRDKTVLINYKGRIPMSLEEIQNGID